MDEPVNVNIQLVRDNPPPRRDGCCSIITLLLVIAAVIACVSAIGGQ